MFRHEITNLVEIPQNSTNTAEVAEIVTTATELENSEHENCDEDDSEAIQENQCHLCMTQFINGAALTDHFRANHPQFYTWMLSGVMN